jgi:hypothetical protein
MRKSPSAILQAQRKAWRSGRDPAMFDAHRRLKGPLRRATGPNSYDEWKLALLAERRAKRNAQ